MQLSLLVHSSLIYRALHRVFCIPASQAAPLSLCNATYYVPFIEYHGRWPNGLGPLIRRMMMTLETLTVRIRKWRQYRASVRELSRLSDRELSDLGIGRGDIDYVARGGVRD